MDLVIDANIVFSALINSSGSSCDLLFSDRLNLSAPEFLKEEIEKHKKEILMKTGLDEKELDIALSLLFTKIKLVPFSEFKQHSQKAKSICPDPDDTEYFALAMALKCPVWSNEKRLKLQEMISVINTAEMIELLK
jgi:predicted nucleic acid-binding protein